jgi:hypothetical protein
MEQMNSIGILEDMIHIGKIPVVPFGTKDYKYRTSLKFLYNSIFHRNFGVKLT